MLTFHCFTQGFHLPIISLASLSAASSKPYTEWTRKLHERRNRVNPSFLLVASAWAACLTGPVGLPVSLVASAWAACLTGFLCSGCLSHWLPVLGLSVSLVACAWAARIMGYPQLAQVSPQRAQVSAQPLHYFPFPCFASLRFGLPCFALPCFAPVP